MDEKHFYNVFQRKSPRHKWRVIVSELNKERADWLAIYYAKKTREWGKDGDKWQIGMSEHYAYYATDYVGLEDGTVVNKPRILYTAQSELG